MKAPELDIRNINKPTGSKWSKIAAVLALASTTFAVGAETSGLHWMVWVTPCTSFLSGSILVLINGKS